MLAKTNTKSTKWNYKHRMTEITKYICLLIPKYVWYFYLDFHFVDLCHWGCSWTLCMEGETPL